MGDEFAGFSWPNPWNSMPRIFAPYQIVPPSTPGAPPSVNVGSPIGGGTLYNTATVGGNITQWLQQNFYDGIVALGAVGVMLVGLWMIAGRPKPQVIPIPA